MEEKDFFGIVVYSIEDDGCLNGLWANIGDPNSIGRGEIKNDIARKREKSDCLAGVYTDTYIGDLNEVHSVILTIENSDNNYYLLTWTVDNNAIFKGKGFKFGKQLVVSYWMGK